MSAPGLGLRIGTVVSVNSETGSVIVTLSAEALADRRVQRLIRPPGRMPMRLVLVDEAQ